MSLQRIDKILSHEGFGTRKGIKKLLRVSEVTVNGTKVTDTGFQVNPDRDVISIDGEELCIRKNHYIMMNKKRGYVSANKDGQHPTVFDLLDESYRTPYLQENLHLVGRLDMDTEGLLLFTTDGELTHRLISPKTHISKTYFCVLEHSETDEHKQEIARLFKEGIEVGPDDNEPGFKCEPATIKWATEDEFKLHTNKSSVLEALSSAGVSFNAENAQNQVALLTIYEGKYHQVKRMFAAVGNKVVFLKRISVGKLELDKTLEPGKYRELLEEEINKLILPI